MEINQGIQADSTSQLSTQFEPIPDVGTPDSDPQVDHVYSKDVKAMETTGEAILGVS